MADASRVPQRPEPPDRPQSSETQAEKLASLFAFFAETEFRGYCPLYERIAQALADNPHVLHPIAGAGIDHKKLIPVLLNAAVHDLTLAEPDLGLARIYRGEEGPDADPWPAYRQILEDRLDDVLSTMRRQSIQTNEVGRSAVLIPALAAVHHPGGPDLALVEIGSSAGLNLMADRYLVEYSDGRATGPADSPVRIECQVLGPTPPPVPVLPDVIPIRSREGIDLSPVDVTEDRACRWLEACVWPQVPMRAERLRAAIELARSDPPRLHRGDAVELLAPVVAELPGDLMPVVFATWVLAYLPSDRRAELAHVLDEIGRERPLAFITAEYPSVAPWATVSPPLSLGTGRGASVLAVSRWEGGERRSVTLAWMHAHGHWIEWVDPGTSRRWEAFQRVTNGPPTVV